MGQNSAHYKTLSKEEKNLIKTSFVEVQKNLMACGSNLFITLFTDYPEIIEFFPFKTPEEDAFEQHCQRFMQGISSFVKNIDNPDKLLKILTNNAKSHVGKNITKDFYNVIQVEFFRTLEKQLGSETFSPPVTKAWNKALKIAFGFLHEKLVEFEKQTKAEVKLSVFL